MNRSLFAFLWIILIPAAGQLYAGDILLTRAPKTDKINERFRETLNQKPAESKTKVWIFFTDKEVFDQASLERALENIRDHFSPRSIKRRINRTNNHNIFDFHDLPVSSTYIELLKPLGIEIVNQSRWLNAVSAYADREAIEKAARCPFVYEIKPVARAVRKPIPDIDNGPGTYGIPKKAEIIPDSLIQKYGQSFTQLNQINIPLMHMLGYTGRGILIAVFDNGFDLGHPALRGLDVLADSSFDITHIDNPNSPYHGTPVLSVLGGQAVGTLLGSAFGAEFLLAKTELNSVEIPAEEDYWAAAAEWADIMGADIISSSVGYIDWYDYPDLDGNTATVTIAADLAVSRGIAVFNSAGNERNTGFYYIAPPADGDSVIAVGAVTESGEITIFSSAGPTYDGRIKPDLVAMGANVFTANYPATPMVYASKSGTSFSCPLAAGAGALLLQAHPDWSPIDLRQAMVRSANRYNNPDNLYGYGLFDTFKAAALVKFLPSAPIRVAIGDTINRLMTAVASDDNAAISITALDLPATAIFTDNGDGTGILQYKGLRQDVGTREIRFVATDGFRADTLAISMFVFERAEIAVGPNPFADSLTIFCGAEAGVIKEISIHSVNGEKVWDDYSDTYNREKNEVVWHGVNNRGIRVSSGVYLVLVRTDKTQKRIKVFKK
jgi:serine protease AprX